MVFHRKTDGPSWPSERKKIVTVRRFIGLMPLLATLILYLAMPGCTNFRTKQLQKRVTDLEIRMSQLESDANLKTSVPNVPADVNSIPPLK